MPHHFEAAMLTFAESCGEGHRQPISMVSIRDGFPSIVTAKSLAERFGIVRPDPSITRTSTSTRGTSTRSRNVCCPSCTWANGSDANGDGTFCTNKQQEVITTGSPPRGRATGGSIGLSFGLVKHESGAVVCVWFVEFPGFSGQALASGFSRRSDAEVQAPGPWKSPIDLRLHQDPSRSVQRPDDVPHPRGRGRAATTSGCNNRSRTALKKMLGCFD